MDARVTPPEAFNFRRPEEWTRWKRRFDRYRVVSGLNAKEDAAQINTLIYCMGDDAEDILASFNLSEDDAKKYGTVETKFNDHFNPRKNVIFERAKFNSRKQEEGEPVDAFITALYKLAEHCNYGDLRNEMIRDRIVVGIRDARLSERLQLDHKLTLDDAVTAVRQSEQVKQQQTVLRGTEVKPEIPIGAVQKGHKHRQQADEQQNEPNKSEKCNKCGKAPGHSRERCPAKDAICHKCKKRGHFQTVCHSAKVSGVDTEEEKPDAFLGAVGDNHWTVDLHLDNTQVKLCIDTGAEVTVVSDKTWRDVRSPTLKSPERKLRGPDDHPLAVLGQWKGTLENSSTQTKETIFVVEGLSKPLLGRPAIQSLQLVTRVATVNKKLSPQEQYPNLFTGRGELEGDYTIRLREGAKPLALSAPRSKAELLRREVMEELNKFEKLGVIKRETEPTDWCTGNVAVPKQNLMKLNESISIEKYQLSVDQTPAEPVAGGKYKPAEFPLNELHLSRTTVDSTRERRRSRSTDPEEVHEKVETGEETEWELSET